MESNMGYIIGGNGAEVSLTLPADPAVGDIIRIRDGTTSSKWRLLPGAANHRIQGAEGLWSAGEDYRWEAISASDNGQYLVATILPGVMAISSDAGNNWVRLAFPGDSKPPVMLSGDGMNLITFNFAEKHISTSEDGGQTWTRLPSIPAANLSAITASADGTRIVVAGYGQLAKVYLYGSSDGGNSWRQLPIPGEGQVNRVLSSADGMKITVLRYLKPNLQELALITSADGGETWIKLDPPEGEVWTPDSRAIASSADGMVIISTLDQKDNVTWNRTLATSTDGGQTWTKHTAAGWRAWQEVSVSRDGRTFYAKLQESRFVDVPPFAGFVHSTLYRFAIGETEWSPVWRSRAVGAELLQITTNGDGSAWFGINRFAWDANQGVQLPFSSINNSFSELKGSGELQLMYLGGGLFGRLN
jgi:hypothetical protein